MSSMTHRLRRHTAAACLAAGLVLTTAACSSSSGGDSSDSAAGKGDDTQVKFAQCLRDHGVQPGSDGGGSKSGTKDLIAPGQDQKKVEAAVQACNTGDSQVFNKPKSNPRRAAQVRPVHAQEGLDYPDPDPNQGNKPVYAPAGKEDQWDKASKKCGHLILDGVQGQQ
ncbi:MULTISPECIES: hypothetical protein [unclassified Streptomyces]|uniref:hypothetical protein n=1 Tax=unclassified Streptomyces TaxID=2593676 RepID=UPI00382BEA47